MKKKNEPPKTPEYVLFGLIFVNFGPLKIFQKYNHLISVEIQINN